MLTSFNPILTDLQTIYGGVDLFALTFCTSLISPVTFPFVNLIANYFNDEFGMKVGISIANILMVIGYIFRVFLVNGVAYIFIGQAMASIAMPFVLNSPQKISGLWFSPQERALATTCLSLANFAGMAAGFVLPSFYLTGTTNTET
jgi:cyanate permease